MALLRSNLGRSFRTVQEASEPRTRLVEPRPSPRIARLREALSNLERSSAQESGTARAGFTSLPLGLGEIDAYLPGSGLATGALHEVAPSSHNDRPAAMGFAMALMSLATRTRARCGPPVLVLSRPALRDFGILYGHGFTRFGLDAGHLLLIETRTDKDALWALEETLRSSVRPSLVLGLIDGSGASTALQALTQSRRLSLAAASSSTPIVLSQAPRAEPASAALTRWRIAAAPTREPGSTQSDTPSLLRTRWSLTLERCRNGRTGHWTIEWDHAAYRFHLAQELAHRTPAQGRAENILRFGGRS
jgi:protein ImuA